MPFVKPNINRQPAEMFSPCCMFADFGNCASTTLHRWSEQLNPVPKLPNYLALLGIGTAMLASELLLLSSSTLVCTL